MDDIRKGTCPRCSHNRVIHLTQVADRVGDLGRVRMRDGDGSLPDVGQFYPLRLARVRNPEAAWFDSEVQAIGVVQAYACRNCGYTELYTKSVHLIPIDNETAFEIVGPEPAGPYR
jgi:DNA-directed RNA polymerase subunit RPC12/RpoP